MDNYNVLNRTGYFVNNPIVVDFEVPEQIREVVVYISSGEKSGSVTLYPRKKRITYDLSYVISSFFEPSNYDPNDSVYGNDTKSIISVLIRFDLIQEFNLLYNTFTRSIKALRGGYHNDMINVGFDNNISLSLLDSRYYFVQNPAITSSTNINNNEVENTTMFPDLTTTKIPTSGCNNVFVIFQNHLGGYSYWLFEDFEVRRKSEDTDILINDYRNNRKWYKTTGNEVEYQVTLISRVDHKYFPIINSLSSSAVVWAKGLPNMQGQGKNDDYKRLINNGQSTKIMSNTQVQDFKLTFDYPTSVKNNKTW